LELLDTPEEEAFDRVTRLVPRLLGAPLATISLLDENRQFFKSAVGLPEPWASKRESSLAHSYCRWVVASGKPFLVENSQNDARVAHSLGHSALGVASYLGIPLFSATGQAVGTFCAMDWQPHTWDDRQVRLATELSELIHTEIELRWQRAELRRANRSKDRFLLMLAHELRNPLAPIRTALKVLEQSGSESDRGRRSHEILSRQVQHLAYIVDDLLDVSGVVGGHVRLRREDRDLAELVCQVLDERRDALERAGLTLRSEMPEGPVPVRVDPTRIAQAIENLLDNAIKFTGAGGQIIVQVRRDADAPLAVLTIRDTGVGIPTELLPHLFETFSQADESLDRSAGGLGIGLSLVKGLVELHHGDIQAYSAGVGRGAEFTVWLPLYQALATPRLNPAPPRAKASHRVLVIEDNRDMADTLRDLLELDNCEVHIAYNGRQGIDQALCLQPDTILCDIGLPGLDGFAVAQALRGDGRTRSAHLIAVTGYGSQEDQRRAQRAGFDCHLTKPFDPEELLRIIRTDRNQSGPLAA
jgi:signal transduction histidine kinase/CheY-like chemotaxis protein